MKYLIFTLLFVVAGCDTPTRSRFPGTSSGNLGDPFSVTPTPTSPTSPATPTTPVTPGFESCNLTKSYSTTDLGSLGVCKNTQDPTLIRFVSSQAFPNDSRICFVPTYKDSAGNSTYLGGPQCTGTNPEQAYTGRLDRSRAGFGSYPLNGVMVMREGLLVEYFRCMDAYSWYMVNSNTCRFYPNSPACIQEAQQFRNTTCTTFKQKYPNNYLDLYLR